MRPGSGAVALCLAACALSVPACSDLAGPERNEDNGTPSEDLSIHFVETGTLELLPLEARKLEVITDPSVAVRFLLIGATADSSLDTSEIVTDENGRGAVTLLAPSKASTFRVVASAGDRARAEISVAVSDNGFATIRVVPAYQGVRPVSTWHASATVAASCASIIAGFPKDPEGALYATSEPTETPVIASVPVGPTVAVAIRSRELMWGCKEVTLPDRQPIDLTVPVLDRPLVLGKVPLDMELEFVPVEMTDYAKVIDASKNAVIDSIVGQDFTATFLDAVEATMTASERADFHGERLALYLDDTVRQQLASDGVDVEATIGTWLTEDAFMAPTSLRARLVQSDAPDTVDLEVQSLGPVDGASLGAPPKVSWTWSTGVEDKVFFGGQIPFSNTLFVSAFAVTRAQADYPQANTVSEAMSLLLDCESLGPILDTAASCVGCGVDLCESGLAYLWTTALAGAANTATLDVSVSAAATVGTDAAATSFAGSWVGQLSASGKEATLNGTASGATPTIE